ncbi:MAG: FlgO family outer membrane protein [Desulfonatronovibrio sp.]
MKRLVSIIIMVMVFCSLSGTAYSWAPNYNRGFIRTESLPGITYQAADVLEYNLTSDISRTLPIMFSSFVDLNNLKSTSALGRLLGEQIGSRFSQHGYNVIEARLRTDSLQIRAKTGEIALSRDTRDIRTSWDPQAIITGTYHIFDDKAVVSARIVSTVDNSIISSHDFSFKLDRYLSTLVTPQSTVLEREKSSHERASTGPISSGAITLSPNRSTDAKLIQKRLADLGLYLDRIDGIWGKNSKIALERFKINHQLPDPDKWNVSTQMRLFQDTNQ